jgi:hypothetical protein
MKTDDLIKALAADAKSVEPPIARTLAIAVGAGALLSLIGFMITIGPRPDFFELLSTSVRYTFKLIVMLSLAIPAFFLVRGLSRPDFKPDASLWWLAFAPALLLLGIGLELASVPSDTWHARMIGHNSFYCMTIIPILSLAPFIAVIYALKSGAPSYPTIAGAVGGVLSAGIGATLYASHCPDDSPLFVALWYPVGFVLMTVLGALIGSRFLRW